MTTSTAQNFSYVIQQITAEKGIIQGLHSRISDQNHKQYLQWALNFLTDVEAWFNDPTEGERRQSNQLWLDHAVNVLGMASQMRVQTQALVDKYGYNFVTI